MDQVSSPLPPVITAESIKRFLFGEYRKTATTRISEFTVPPGTPFQTPEGLKAEDEPCRVAFDSQGGVYPIRESVFRETFEKEKTKAPEAVSIANSFRRVAERLHQATERGEDISREAIIEAVASEVGIPLEQLIEAAWKESRVGMAFMLIVGPRRAICTASVAAFIAGAAWEQGRRG